MSAILQKERCTVKLRRSHCFLLHQEESDEHPGKVKASTAGEVQSESEALSPCIWLHHEESEEHSGKESSILQKEISTV